MMRTRRVILPDGWPCSLADCRPGFFMFHEALCLKTGYRKPDGDLEAYNKAGEIFWGARGCMRDRKARENLIVQPVMVVMEDTD